MLFFRLKLYKLYKIMLIKIKHKNVLKIDSGVKGININFRI